MTTILQGKMNATGKTFGIVATRFNEFITAKLIDGAIDALVRHGADDTGSGEIGPHGPLVGLRIVHLRGFHESATGHAAPNVDLSVELAGAK
jgi:hypothetical protein